MLRGMRTLLPVTITLLLAAISAFAQGARLPTAQNYSRSLDDPWPVTLGQVAFGIAMGMAVSCIKGWLR